MEIRTVTWFKTLITDILHQFRFPFELMEIFLPTVEVKVLFTRPVASPHLLYLNFTYATY